MSIGINTSYNTNSYVTNNASRDKEKTTRSTEDYTKYLQNKYDYMNKSTSMEGIPTTVSVSPAFIKKCTDDPEKAKFLEQNLAAIPDCVSKAIAGCQGTLTNLSYQFDANGNISIAISGSSDPDGKIAKENAERKAKEQKAAEEKSAKRRAENKAEEEKIAKKCAEKVQTEEPVVGDAKNEINISATGSSVESVTQSIMASMNSNTGAGVIGFDVKA